MEQSHPLLQFLRPLLGRLRNGVPVADPEAGVLGDELDLGQQDVPLLLVLVSQQNSGGGTGLLLGCVISPLSVGLIYATQEEPL